MIDQEAYSLRIARATPALLVVITFELIADYLNDALASDGFARVSVEKAKNGVTQLIKGLNFEVAMAHDFYEIYQYIHKRLNDALRNATREPLAEALELAEQLLTGWREAASLEEATAPALASHVPPVYAGLTYQRGGGLSEYVAQDESRGFKA
jgi:flagellin-specific chaperone FliS